MVWSGADLLPAVVTKRRAATVFKRDRGVGPGEGEGEGGALPSQAAIDTQHVHLDRRASSSVKRTFGVRGRM